MAEYDDVTCKGESPKAILVEIEGDDYWVPQSQVLSDSEVWEDGDMGTLVVNDWWVRKGGLP